MQADRAAANGIILSVLKMLLWCIRILCLRFQSVGARKWRAHRDNPLPLTLQ